MAIGANESSDTVRSLPETEDGTEQLPTVEDLAKERQQRKAEIAKAREIEAASKQETAATTAPGGDVEQLEEEADQQGAFNPETGEINWDCPCLGGMAHGPCGEEFKAAFSCFVYSTEEPKGMDCIDKFKYGHFASDNIEIGSLMVMIGTCRTASDSIPKSTALNLKPTKTTT